MNRKTFDVLVPLVYAIAVVVAFVVGDEAGLGGVAVIGAVCVAIYYATLRQNIKAGPES